MEMFSCALGYKPDFTLEVSVTHLVPQPWELTGVPGTTGVPHNLQKGVISSDPVIFPSPCVTIGHLNGTRGACSGNWIIHQCPGQLNSFSYFINCINTMPIFYNEISDTSSSFTHGNLNCSYLIKGLDPSPMFLMCMDGSGCGSTFLFLGSMRRSQTKNFD